MAGKQEQPAAQFVALGACLEAPGTGLFLVATLMDLLLPWATRRCYGRLGG